MKLREREKSFYPTPLSIDNPCVSELQSPLEENFIQGKKQVQLLIQE